MGLSSSTFPLPALSSDPFPVRLCKYQLRLAVTFFSFVEAAFWLSWDINDNDSIDKGYNFICLLIS